jgi:hypothetical protein
MEEGTKEAFEIIHGLAELVREFGPWGALLIVVAFVLGLLALVGVGHILAWLLDAKRSPFFVLAGGVVAAISAGAAVGLICGIANVESRFWIHVLCAGGAYATAYGITAGRKTLAIPATACGLLVAWIVATLLYRQDKISGQDTSVFFTLTGAATIAGIVFARRSVRWNRT